MSAIHRSVARLAAVGLLGMSVGVASALDIVHRKSTDKVVGGDITKVSREGVVVKQPGDKEENVPANDISYIEWNGEPGPLKLARGNDTTGNLDEALKNYDEAVKATGSGSEGLKAEAAYGLARSTAIKAIRSGENLSDAVAKLKAFVNGNRDNYRLFDAQLLLGDLLLASKDYLTADVSYQSVVDAPWPDYQMSGKIGLARAALGRGDVAKARGLFDEVAAAPAANPAETSRKLEAMLGQSRCFLSESDTESALKTVKQVISDATPADARVQAAAYVLQGDAYQKAGNNPKLAAYSYLRIDVIPDFAAEGDLHAEALYHLSKLWPAIGEANRGADAAARLQTQYPTSEWTKKLGDAPAK